MIKEKMIIKRPEGVDVWDPPAIICEIEYDDRETALREVRESIAKRGAIIRARSAAMKNSTQIHTVGALEIPDNPEDEDKEER